MVSPASVTSEDVQAWLGITGKITGADDLANLNAVVATVNAYVSALPVAAIGVAAEPPYWPDSVWNGAVMLAARYYRRRNSPNGVEAITESGAQYIARYDSDIARLLQIEVFIRPAVG
jgi:hypothetical protein